MNKETKKLGDEEAFPLVHKGFIGFDAQDYPVRGDIVAKGMSRRFYAACAAMQGILAGNELSKYVLDPVAVIQQAYNYADELLKQENNEKV